jgi:hypothetical protein
VCRTPYGQRKEQMLPNMGMLSMLHVLCVEGALSLRFDVVVYVLTSHLQRKFWVGVLLELI